MAFKLTGDAYDDYKTQKQQRVADLLAANIPQDEARKERNGRYVCLVCPHCPLFDTMAMLVVHRKGKKHQAHDKEYFQRKLKKEAARVKAARFDQKSSTQPAPLLQATRDAIAEAKKTPLPAHPPTQPTTHHLPPNQPQQLHTYAAWNPPYPHTNSTHPYPPFPPPPQPPVRPPVGHPSHNTQTPFPLPYHTAPPPQTCHPTFERREEKAEAKEPAPPTIVS